MDFPSDVEMEAKEWDVKEEKKDRKAIPPALWLSDTNEVSNVESVKLIKVT